tara:strand:+ start:1933 stop:2163 length:231 start_codon:yes stop_codon:yes gene_type:complete
MKIVLVMIICSAMSGTCDQPFQNKNTFSDWDSCMRQGYTDSLQILDLMGAEFVNENGAYIRFTCKEVKDKRKEINI